MHTCTHFTSLTTQGVGAIFYTQVALAALPPSPRTEHLRAVLIPINYFLVFTSIVVHGITIPVGKTFHRSGIMQLTRSWTTSGTGNGNATPRRGKASRPTAPVEISAISSPVAVRRADGTGSGSGTVTPSRMEMGDDQVRAKRMTGGDEEGADGVGRGMGGDAGGGIKGQSGTSNGDIGVKFV